ncbi:HTH domain-containing protein [Rhodopirellula sp. MGV]|uniref:HTH domain-containing protein n=1 Tax=Rhodopirellula sp. MGV TaxID=2023130 RepID=UPI000B975426|nr:helix-turn-helix domain-containing protein [Rhodopirellula sp. MGV]OYP33805.1 hypothetical protein CGZ80_17830 [Rhodopirellula sp. MGV]PNY37533.1 helix-turn-helix domain-containing protein [Rhodopirellula baltica]
MRHRLDRALEILRLVHSGVAADPHTITSELNVNRRTFYRDIAFLKELGVEISFDHREGRYKIAGLAGADQGDDCERFQQVIGQAIRQSGESSTVVSIIRHAAAILTGEETIAEEQADVLATEADVQLGAGLSPRESLPRVPHHDGWRPTRSNLGSLTEALDRGKRILSIAGDPSGINRDIQHLLIRQITITADKVIVEGIDQNGRLVRTASSFIKKVDDGVLQSVAAEAARTL